MFTKNNRLCRYWQQCNYHNPFSPDCSRSVHHTTYNQPKREAKKKAMKESASPDREKEKQIFTWLLILCTSLTLCPSISWSGFGANSTSWPVHIKESSLTIIWENQGFICTQHSWFLIFSMSKMFPLPLIEELTVSGRDGGSVHGGGDVEGEEGNRPTHLRKFKIQCDVLQVWSDEKSRGSRKSVLSKSSFHGGSK